MPETTELELYYYVEDDQEIVIVYYILFKPERNYTTITSTSICMGVTLHGC